MSISRDKEISQGSIEKLREDGRTRGFFVSGRGVHFRQMNTSDIEDILTIEKDSFSYPWSARFFLQELKVPCARSLLAVMGEKIIGYIIYWSLPHELDIHNLAVHSAYRRRGVGRSLLQAVIDEAKRENASRVTLEVRKSNETAQRLYQLLGFVSQGVRKGYYTDDGEDALAMVLDFGG